MTTYKWTPEWKQLRAEFDANVALGMSKSALFARMAVEHKLTAGPIAFITGSHYSFVYGVVSTKTDIIVKKESNRSDEIRALSDQGKTVGEISHLLNANYSWVHSVVKKHKLG